MIQRTGLPTKARGGLGFKGAILALGLAALAVLPLVVVLTPGMLPTLVTLLVERQRPRYLSYTVGVMNSAGVLPILLALAKGHVTMAAVAVTLANPMSWIVMYGAAAAGWLISGATPPLARFCLDIQASQKRRALEALSRAIRREWGDEVVGGQKSPPAADAERDDQP